MMREILFRGKRKKDGEWLYGDLMHSLGRTYCGIYAETLGEIRPETVGQFTGLTANGKGIFEGDIVKAAEKEDTDLVGAVMWKFECWTVSGANWADSLYMANYLHKLVVIGNVHDNPELLKGRSA